MFALGNVLRSQFSRPVRVGADVLKLESNLGLLALHDHVGKDDSEKGPGLFRSRNPRKGVSRAPLARVAAFTGFKGSTNDGASVLFFERHNDGRKAVRDVHPENVPDGIPALGPDDRDAAVCVKKTGGVFRRQHGSLLSAYDGMVVNSVELRCPARKGAEGQYRAKQERDGALGVCNEQVPPSKEKVCSVLTGNRERAAEMTAPAMTVSILGAPVPCQQASNKKGDRQCPTGRAYFLRTDDTYFMVDPRFLFKWTGDLTYPDQMAFTRLCGLRFFMKTERRMFQAVVDGVTA